MRIELGTACRDYASPSSRSLPWTGEGRLPFGDGTVDAVLLEGCLEYARDLPAALRELFRVCRHKALVCLLAPYAHAAVHMANPYLRQRFNEHSPRFWSPYPPAESAGWEDAFPLPEDWSLVKGAAQPAGTDFRLLRMEVFHFPQYAGLYDRFELSLLRQSQLNVAHRIMYHLLAVKEPVPEEELDRIARCPLEEPPGAAALRFVPAEEPSAGERPFAMDVRQAGRAASAGKTSSPAAVRRRARSLSGRAWSGRRRGSQARGRGKRRGRGGPSRERNRRR
ncbi:methyltransferase domain-containing protein [Paenibacillus glufosinatiresistens]|uniref:methyltransferase domain-containing protein n=1 Tax=Paenibacillus glufosinatiresistens TaxID=3070657 RepID=UPI00286DCD7B|nr:methyltransferase domain-containing protein [Paenibacillus sp. YX.27]